MSYKSKYFICDTETGGLKPSDNPIMEIAYIVIDPYTFEEIVRWDTLVKHYANLEYNDIALNTHGISLADIKREGIEVEEMVDHLIKVFKDITPKGDKGGGRPILVGHNIGFDIDMMEYAFDLCEKKLSDYVLSNSDNGDDIHRLDTIGLSKLLWDNGNKNSYTLSKSYERAGLGTFSAHRAMADVEATKELLSHFKDLIRGNNPQKRVAGEAIVQTQKGKKELPPKEVRKKYQF